MAGSIADWLDLCLTSSLDILWLYLYEQLITFGLIGYHDNSSTVKSPTVYLSTDLTRLQPLTVPQLVFCPKAHE